MTLNLQNACLPEVPLAWQTANEVAPTLHTDASQAWFVPHPDIFREVERLEELQYWIAGWLTLRGGWLSAIENLKEAPEVSTKARWKSLLSVLFPLNPEVRLPGSKPPRRVRQAQGILTFLHMPSLPEINADAFSTTWNDQQLSGSIKDVISMETIRGVVWELHVILFCKQNCSLHHHDHHFLCRKSLSK
jgi:hypothetical protein